MIVSWLLTARAFLARVPWQVWCALAIVAAAWLWGNHRYSQGVHAERAKWEAAAAKAVEQARKADGVAVETANAGKATIEEGNERAKEAARNSDDPLRAGLDSLR